MTHELFDIDIEGYQPVEVLLKSPDDFLKIRETLSRIGVASRKDNTLYQTCHILHKRSRYFIVMFKELFLLDGKTADLTENDIQRRNTIATLLEEWGLLTILYKDVCQNRASLTQIKVLSFKEKKDWKLITKYSIGKK